MSNRSRQFILAIWFASLGCGLSVSVPVMAQSYPAKPIRMIVPYPPGGIDIFMRAVAPKAAEMLGQPIILDNRGGANGFIGTEMLARAEPDGHTLGFISSSTMVSGPVLSKRPTFDPIKDFTPVAYIVETTLVLTVSSAVPVSSVKELIEYASRNPGKLSYASSGIGSTFHLNGEKFKLLTGVDMVHVPYKGSAPMATDLLAGRVEVGFPALNNINAYLSSGKFKMLAVMAKKRNPELPNIPAIGEVVPGFPPQTPFQGVYAPARLAQAITSRLNVAFNKAMETPEFRQLATRNGAVIVGGPPEQLGDTVKADLKEVSDLVQRLGIPKE